MTGAATFCHSLALGFYWADISSDAILAMVVQTVAGRVSSNPVYNPKSGSGGWRKQRGL